MKFRFPRSYFFADGNSIRLRAVERDFIARAFRQRKVRSKALLDEMIGAFYY